LVLAFELIGRWFPDDFLGALALLCESAICLGTAVVGGMIVGLEREQLHKPAGVRTHILVCVGSAGFVHLGVMAHTLGLGLGSIADFNRLIQSIATGIGFLGAGAIFRGGSGVHGVTTAASIWIMGAVGAAAGAGALALSLVFALSGYLVLRWLRILETGPGSKKGAP
jgi:putative Mg2+ transporter-C (MgtC) family protein